MNGGSGNHVVGHSVTTVRWALCRREVPHTATASLIHQPGACPTHLLALDRVYSNKVCYSYAETCVYTGEGYGIMMHGTILPGVVELMVSPRSGNKDVLAFHTE